ncbi:MAG: prepilin-type N-terminal cleavage/methylation domain-containing protein [Syntrophobacterales bacterium]
MDKHGLKRSSVCSPVLQSHIDAMISFNPRRKGSCQGFTLVEVLVSVAIVATLFAIALPMLEEYKYRANVTHAIGDIHTIQSEIAAFAAENGREPDNNVPSETPWIYINDPWGRPYEYLDFATDTMTGPPTDRKPANARKDGSDHPINTDYDLYSRGKDGQTKLGLLNEQSYDDIIRANDGRYIGLAYKF